jgi:hypothetical protein
VAARRESLAAPANRPHASHIAAKWCVAEDVEQPRTTNSYDHEPTGLPGATALMRESRQLRRRLDEVNMLGAGKGRSVQDARHYVEAMLGFEVYCHRLYQGLQAPAHHGHGGAQSASAEWGVDPSSSSLVASDRVPS